MRTAVPNEKIFRTFKRTRPETREKEMVERYGEVVNKKKAAEILDYHIITLNKLLEDGVIQYACAGKKVDVRSLARFIDTPPETVKEYRRQRRMAANGTANRWGI